VWVAEDRRRGGGGAASITGSGWDERGGDG
jgi:hypothetical protein